MLKVLLSEYCGSEINKAAVCFCDGGSDLNGQQ
jgi:hypothetical protein